LDKTVDDLLLGKKFLMKNQPEKFP